MNKTIYLRKIAPLCCAVALLASCSSKSSSSSSTVVMPDVSNNTTSTYTPPTTTTTPTTTPDIVEDAVSEATVTVEQNEITMNLGLTYGSSAVGAARLIRDNMEGTTANVYNVSILSSKEEVMAFLSSGTNHVATVPSDLAAQYYSENHDISVLAVTSYSDMQLLVKGGTVSSLADMAGKTIWAEGSGTAYEAMVAKEFANVGLTVGVDVNIQYMSAEEVREKMLWNQEGYGLLGVPSATQLTLESEDITSVMIVGESQPMYCLVVKQFFVEENETQVSHFLLDYQISLAYMQGGADDIGDLVLNVGTATDLAAATLAASQSNLVCLTGSAMKSALQMYYSTLYEADSSLVGGGLPYDDFYYGA